MSLFKSASPGCRKCLAQLITTRFATPGEYLVNQGDALQFIYFVCSGSLEILGEEGTVVGLLGKFFSTKKRILMKHVNLHY